LRKEAETNKKGTKGLILLTKETFSLKVLNTFFMNLHVLYKRCKEIILNVNLYLMIKFNAQKPYCH